MVSISSSSLRSIKIGIIDIFGKKKAIPINGVKKDFTHGDMTSAVLEKLTDDLPVNITRIPVKVRDDSNASFQFKSLLKQLKKINRNNEKLDYLNISTSHVLPYELTGILDDVSKLKDVKVRQAFYDTLPEQVKHVIAELERITSEGTRVYISACNKKNGFNALSLAQGVHTIGGRNGSTLEPIRRFSVNPLVNSYENLPIYISKKQSIINETDKTALNLSKLIPIESDLSKLSKFELRKKIATKNDYERLEQYVNQLYSSGKFNFDIDFMRYKLVSSVDKNLKNKIFEIDKFMKIFEGKFDDEVLKYTFPQGTHCDLQFRQFFDMKSKSRHVMPMTKTTKIPNTVSGTSFAAPQGLNTALREDIKNGSFSIFC